MAKIVIPKDENTDTSVGVTSSHTANNMNSRTGTGFGDENAVLRTKNNNNKTNNTNNISHNNTRTVLGELSNSDLNRSRQSQHHQNQIPSIQKQHTNTAHESSSHDHYDAIISDYEIEKDNDSDIEIGNENDTSTNVTNKENSVATDAASSSATSSSASYLQIPQFQPVMNDQIMQEIQAVFSRYDSEHFNPDDLDFFDTTMVSEYRPQIMNHLHELEMKYLPDSNNILNNHKEISYIHRKELILWIVQIHQRFNLLPETLYLTINIMDRFLSLKPNISLTRYQLCGTAALFIASKFEEVNYPTVKQMCYILSNQFTTEQFMEAEKYMIRILEFNVNYPGPMSFLRFISKADGYDNEIRNMAKYFLEITIVDEHFISTPISFSTAAAMLLSRRVLAKDDAWSKRHIFYSGYLEEQMVDLCNYIFKCCLNYKTHHLEIFNKYNTKRFGYISDYVQRYLQTIMREAFDIDHVYDNEDTELDLEENDDDEDIQQ